jgi:hypothetical protein
MNPTTCAVCQTPARERRDAGEVEVWCLRCGHFRLTDIAEADLQGSLSQHGARGIALVSGWLREHQGSLVSGRDVGGILEMRRPSVGERAERLLVHLAKSYPKAGADFAIITDPVKQFVAPLQPVPPSSYLEQMRSSDPTLRGVGFCQDWRELTFLMEDYLWRDRGFLKKRDGLPEPYQITPAGWARVHELQHVHGSGTQGFIAMWFDEQVKAASGAIGRGIEAAGYNSVLMNQVEHNNRIDDEIIARIRGSKFLVADLTRSRGGVYFEAGFALGLGLRVIWLCREDDLANVHFDNRQYNFITWRAEALDQLEKRLKDRIEATLGHGPLK